MNDLMRQARQEQAKALHELADDIGMGRLPLPGPIHVYMTYTQGVVQTWGDDGKPTDYVGYDEPVTVEVARAAMASAPGNWTKKQAEDQIRYEKSYGEKLVFSMGIWRSQVCERVQVGTRHVEAIPAREEPVYEWRCAPEADAS